MAVRIALATARPSIEVPLVRVPPGERLPASTHHPHVQTLTHLCGSRIEREVVRLLEGHAAAEPLGRVVLLDVSLHV